MPCVRRKQSDGGIEPRDVLPVAFVPLVHGRGQGLNGRARDSA
jgi:hypothetical protein